MEAILRRVVRRVAKALVGCGDDLENESDTLAALQAAEVDRRLRYPDPFPHQRRGASVDGFSLHGGVRIHENDRQGLERLCRYLRGLFAPHARERSRVVPTTGSEPATTSIPSASDQFHLRAAKTLRTYRVPWALLLRKVFAWDVLRSGRRSPPAPRDHPTSASRVPTTTGPTPSTPTEGCTHLEAARRTTTP